MSKNSMLALAVALGVTALVPASASAKFGGAGMGHRGMTASSPQRVHAERPAVKFKLIRCHKYARGNGQGGVNWVSVCS